MGAVIDHLPFEVDLDLIRRLDCNGPRYTSYPTADRFIEAFGPETYKSWASKRNIGGIHRALSLYVHLPFCGTVCFYCACNKVVTRDKTKGERYLDYLAREIALQAPLFRDDPAVTQMHWGGGTPTFFSSSQLGELFALLRRHFAFAEGGEYSIEVDPRTVDPDAIAALRKMGFNRLSLGVQDFDPQVQRAVNRVQSEEQTFAVMAAARDERFLSINVDLIYGLPKQNLLTFNRTLARVVEAQPDRIAIYNYAHLPARFKPQRRISESDLPSPGIKLKLLALAAQRLTEAGYVYIGMDHFAKPDDPLAVAQRQGRLHRNFQGYSTHPDCDLIGLGVSAIGSIGPTYSQNFRDLKDYYDSLERGVLPIMRGVELNADNLVRRAVIQALMCHFTLSKDSIEIAYLIDFDRYFASELAGLRELEQLGLLELEERWINVTPKGRMLIRNVCMVFDKYLRRDQEVRRYSRVI
ncbi:MAG: oxygen-independent coproporphyrinogen III oxidase [Betaproteobacteria bacterium RIFCSPLOWO2_12_FULL_62_13]|nr:MAG: oxygen-independent coproporphyrinogen III oxidase [Betaproteobacteria bacterium RIFCSPLOWO2_12_FULL_62_13]